MGSSIDRTPLVLKTDRDHLIKDNLQLYIKGLLLLAAVHWSCDSLHLFTHLSSPTNERISGPLLSKVL